MTKFILHGGRAKDDCADNDVFFREMLVGTHNQVNILLCYFARSESEWESHAQRDIRYFRRNCDDKNLTFEIAKVENLESQILASDVIYIFGGETSRLVQVMKTIPNLNGLLAGKVVGGSSAGAYVFSKYYFENDIKKIGTGLGILNMKIFCHYSEEKESDAKKLRDFGENLPLVTLREHELEIISQ